MHCLRENNWPEVRCTRWSAVRHLAPRETTVGVSLKMQTVSHSIELRRALAVTAGLALLWMILAVARDGVTYHLAPLLVSAVPAAAVGIERQVPAKLLSQLAVAGAAIALGITLLLSASGRLSGPSLLPIGGATAEAVIFSGLGAFTGWAIGMFGSRVAE